MLYFLFDYLCKSNYITQRWHKQLTNPLNQVSHYCVLKTKETLFGKEVRNCSQNHKTVNTLNVRFAIFIVNLTSHK